MKKIICVVFLFLMFVNPVFAEEPKQLLFMGIVSEVSGARDVNLNDYMSCVLYFSSNPERCNENEEDKICFDFQKIFLVIGGFEETYENGSITCTKKSDGKTSLMIKTEKGFLNLCLEFDNKKEDCLKENIFLKDPFSFDGYEYKNFSLNGAIIKNQDDFFVRGKIVDVLDDKNRL